MGEYIETSTTTWVDAELAKPGNDGWSDSVALPQLAGVSHEEVLVLSWVLFLSRGILNSPDGGFSWCGGAGIHGGLLTDVIEHEGNFLGDILKRVGALGQFNEEPSDIILFGNASPGSKVSKMNSVIFIGC